MNNERQIKYGTEETQSLEYLVFTAIGVKIGIYTGVGKNDKIEWQIMTVGNYGDEIEDFFDWHVDHNKQWFDTPIQAAAFFVRKYYEWLSYRQNKK